MHDEKMDGKFKISLLFLAVILIIPVIGPHLIRHDPYAVNVRNAFLSPCKEYLFGTDNLGRCVFCRILAGSRTSIYTALLIVGIVFLVGTLVGILAGFAGGVLDEILMKITLVFQAFPAFVLSIAIAGILGVGLSERRACLKRRVLDNVCTAFPESCGFHETGKLYICRKNERCTALSHDNSLYSAQYDGKPYCNSGYGYWKCNPQYGRTFVSGTRCCASYRRVGSRYERGERLSAESTMDYRFNGLALFLVVTVFQLFGDRLSEFVHKKEARTEN